MKLKLTLLAAVAVLAGCETFDTFAYIDGNRYFRANINTYSVIVLDVDGKHYLHNPVIIDPGEHVIRVQGPRVPGFRFGESRSISLDVKPCTRYYLRAFKESPLQHDFTPEVDYEEAIAGCRVA